MHRLRLHNIIDTVPVPVPGSAGEGSGALAIVPAPRCPISVRLATMDDLPFIDRLQKMHTHMVGWFPRRQFEANIEGGHVLIAEEEEESQRGGRGDRGEAERAGEEASWQHGIMGKSDERCGISDERGGFPLSAFSFQRFSFAPCGSPCSPCFKSLQASSLKTPIGYIIGRDRYMKRDDVGIMYQVNVLPLKHRHLVGATLVKALFDRAAYGCRLYSLWCAQEIQANYFWEALGFIPLAFRTGSRAKQRIHIFWQRRIRDGDEGPNATPYWFPSQTMGGAVAEDRIVLPIPPGTHWRDAKAVLLPGPPEGGGAVEDDASGGPKLLPGGAPVRPRPEQGEAKKKVSVARKAAIARSRSKHLGGVPAGKAAIISQGGVRYIDRADAPPEPPEDEAPRKSRTRKPRPRRKHDPKYVAAARELRDRYLEEMNSPGSDFALPPAAHGKYDVSRQLEAAPTQLEQTPLLDAA